MLLDLPTKSLEVSLLAAPGTPLAVVCRYQAQLPGGTVQAEHQTEVLVGGIGITQVLGPPSANQQYDVTDFSVFNADVAASQVTVQVRVGGAAYVKYRATLQPGENLYYQADNHGFFVVDANGNVRGIVPLPLDAARDSTLGVALTPLSGSVAGAGNTAVVTPAAGKKIRLYYAAYNPSSAGEVFFRFGVAGQAFLRNNLTNAGSVIAKEFGTKYLQGAVDEALYLNLSGAFPTLWNTFHVEV